MPLAQVRQHLGIPGMNVVTAGNFRDKAQMKTVLRAAGVPCARHRLASSAADATNFAERVGFPLVVKPPAGAGAKSTFRLDDHGDRGAWLAVSPPSRPEQAFALGRRWRHNGAMPSVQIKDVPERTHAVLRQRAAAAHQSLQEYLRARLIEEADQPTLEEILDRAGGRSGGSVPFKAAVAAIRDDRARR